MPANYLSNLKLNKRKTDKPLKAKICNFSVHLNKKGKKITLAISKTPENLILQSHPFDKYGYSLIIKP